MERSNEALVFKSYSILDDFIHDVVIFYCLSCVPVYIRDVGVYDGTCLMGGACL